MLCTLARWTLCGLLGMVLLTGCRGGALPERTLRQRVYHRVQRGQTLWSIARAYGVDMQRLARVNHVSNTHVLSVGQKLYIPGATRPRRVASRCPCASDTPKRQRAAPFRPPRSTTGSTGRHPATTARRLRFMWPIQGTITRDFTQGGKHRHDGIDIAAAKDTLIRAAAAGKVIFSDWGPGGYGRTVILRHGTELVTVYAHNHRNLVRVGQSVRQGESIATVGKSGRASGYHLHFEIRRKTVPVSPFTFLSRGQHVAQIGHR